MIVASFRLAILLVILLGTIPVLGTFAASIAKADTVTDANRLRISTYMMYGSGGGERLKNLDKVVLEATKRAGLEVELVPLPLNRGAKLTEAGLYGGHYPRVEAVKDKYPDLIKVDSVLLHDKIIAITMDPKVKIDGWNSLKNYSVGYPRNAVFFDEKANLYGTEHPVQLHKNILTMLDGDRFQVVLLWESYYKNLIKNQVKDIHYIVHSEELGTANAYLFLSPENKDKAQLLADTLDEMKAEGVFGRLCDFCESRLDVKSADLLSSDKLS